MGNPAGSFLGFSKSHRSEQVYKTKAAPSIDEIGYHMGRKVDHGIGLGGPSLPEILSIR